MTCPMCRRDVVVEANFCPWCGAVVDRTKRLPFDDRSLVFLRADLSGFTKLSENMLAEDVMATLNEAFEAFAAIIARNQGNVYQIIGDEIVAIFGLKSGMAFSPHMAIMAADDMIKQLRRKNAGGTPETALHFKIGIEMERTSIVRFQGDLQDALFVTDGFRKSLILQKNAETDTVLVGENLYAATKGFFAYVEAGEFIDDVFAVKGFALKMA